MYNKITILTSTRRWESVVNRNEIEIDVLVLQIAFKALAQEFPKAADCHWALEAFDA